MKSYLVVIVALVALFLGLFIGWQIGHAEAATGIAKLCLIQSVEELDQFQKHKDDGLTYNIRVQMFGAVAGIKRLPRNPFWKLRYVFGNPFDDSITQHFLPIAEKESYPIGEAYFPQHYPPLTSGSSGSH